MIKKLLFISITLYCAISMSSQNFTSASARYGESKGIFQLFTTRQAMSAPAEVSPISPEQLAEIEGATRDIEEAIQKDGEASADPEIQRKLEELRLSVERLRMLETTPQARAREMPAIKRLTLVGSASYDLGDDSLKPVLGALYTLDLNSGPNPLVKANAMLKISPILIGSGDEELSDLYAINGGTGELSFGSLLSWSLLESLRFEAEASGIGSVIISKDDSLPEGNKTTFTFRIDGTATIWLFKTFYFSAVGSLNNLLDKQDPLKTSETFTYKLTGSVCIGKDLYLNGVWKPGITEGVLFGISKVLKL